MGIIAMSEAASKANQFKPRTLTQRQWLEHFKRCDRSGLTVPAYVRSQGLKLATFYRCRKRLLAEPFDQLAQVKPKRSSSAEAAVAYEPLFHSVRVTPHEPPPNSATGTLSLHFRLPNGIKCELLGVNTGNCAAFLESLSRLRP
jgi:hypothetical protein